MEKVYSELKAGLRGKLSFCNLLRESGRGRKEEKERGGEREKEEKRERKREVGGEVHHGLVLLIDFSNSANIAAWGFPAKSTSCNVLKQVNFKSCTVCSYNAKNCI